MVQEPIEKSQRRSSILRGDASPAINKGISKGIVLWQERWLTRSYPVHSGCLSHSGGETSVMSPLTP